MKHLFLLFSLALVASPLLAETGQKISIPENAQKDGVCMVIESTVTETNKDLPSARLCLENDTWVIANPQKAAKAKTQDASQPKAREQEQSKVLGAKKVPKSDVAKTKHRTHTFAHIKKPAPAKKRVSATYTEIR